VFTLSDHRVLRRARGTILAVLVMLAGCQARPEPVPAIASDPVCGAVVNPEKAIKVVFAGRTYYFDSPECASEFTVHASTYTGVHNRHVGSR
jgi:YHS domain-containing protein